MRKQRNLWPGRGHPPSHGGTPTSDCQAPEWWETSLFISHLVYGIFVLEAQTDQNNCIYYFFFNLKHNLFLDSNILSTELSTQWWWLLFESFLAGTVYQLIIQAFPNALTWPIWVGKAIYPQTYAFLPIPRSDQGIVQRWINERKKTKNKNTFLSNSSHRMTGLISIPLSRTQSMEDVWLRAALLKSVHRHHLWTLWKCRFGSSRSGAGPEASNCGWCCRSRNQTLNDKAVEGRQTGPWVEGMWK